MSAKASGLSSRSIGAEDPRDYAVAALAVVSNPPGQWQLQAQVLHWRGDTARGGPTALVTLETARSKLHNCQLTAPLASPSLTTDDPQRLAAVIDPSRRLAAGW